MSVDIIGPLFDPHPTDPEGEPVLLAGWHVNVTPAVLAARPELEPYVVEPTPFRRVWAGDDHVAPVLTVALRFADESQALAVMGGD